MRPCPPCFELPLIARHLAVATRCALIAVTHAARLSVDLSTTIKETHVALITAPSIYRWYREHMYSVLTSISHTARSNRAIPPKAEASSAVPVQTLLPHKSVLV